MDAALICPVVARVREVASAFSSRTAIAAPGLRLTYAQLWDRVRHWQQRFAALGVAAQSLVCLVSDGKAELPAAFLGARAAGLVPMLVDGLLPRARIAAVVAAARPAVVLELARDEFVPQSGPDLRVLGEGAGYVVFSSGSQGNPKGIAGQSLGLVHFVDWEISTLAIKPGTKVAMLTSPSFDVVYRDLLLPLCAGGELHFAENNVRTSPRLVLPWIAENGINLVHAVPSLSSRWLATTEVKASTLQWTLFAGEPLYAQHVQRWLLAAPNTRVVNLYGPSETTLAKFSYEVPVHPEPGLQPVGRPLPGTQFGITVTEGKESIVISTAYGSLGYLEGTCTPQDETRLSREGGITTFITQDRGRLDDHGNLVVAGRIDSLVKRNGVFIDIARIELAAAALPEVRAVCCLQLPLSGRILLAVEGPEPKVSTELRRALLPQLGTELPDKVVVLSSLPLLPGGKVDRRAVRNLISEVEDEVSHREPEHSHM